MSMDQETFDQEYAQMDDFRARVYMLTAQIPPGRVATYGQIAFLGGHPGAARAVGSFLKQCYEHGQHDLPWFRVLTASGGISFKGNLPRATKQLNALEKEGIEFHRKFQCDLETYEWEPSLSYWAIDF